MQQHERSDKIEALLVEMGAHGFYQDLQAEQASGGLAPLVDPETQRTIIDMERIYTNAVKAQDYEMLARLAEDLKEVRQIGIKVSQLRTELRDSVYNEDYLGSQINNIKSISIKDPQNLNYLKVKIILNILNMSNVYKVKINLDNDPSSDLIFNTIVRNNFEFEVNKVLRKEVIYEKEKRFLLFFKRPSEARTVDYRDDVWPCKSKH